MSILLFAAALSAQPLWKDLRAGMTKSEVQALYPTGKTMLSPTCEAKVLPRFEKGSLQAVWLRFGDLMGAGPSQWAAAFECQKIMKASIVEKYGEPLSHETRIKQNPMFKNIYTAGDEYLFKKGSVKVTFYVEQKRPFTVITYEHLPPAEQQAKPEAADNL